MCFVVYRFFLALVIALLVMINQNGQGGTSAETKLPPINFDSNSGNDLKYAEAAQKRSQKRHRKVNNPSLAASFFISPATLTKNSSDDIIQGPYWRQQERRKPPFCGTFWTKCRGQAKVAYRVFGEGVKSARGETAILGCGDHTRNMFGTSLHTAYCRRTIALETAEIMQ